MSKFTRTKYERGGAKYVLQQIFSSRYCIASQPASYSPIFYILLKGVTLNLLTISLRGEKCSSMILALIALKSFDAGLVSDLKVSHKAHVRSFKKQYEACKGMTVHCRKLVLFSN